MGIMTDTGNFTHQDVDKKAHLVTAELIDKGANLNEIYYHNFKKQTKARAKLFGMVMSKLRYFNQDRLCVATIFQKDLQSIGAHQSETEGFVDFIMGIDGVEVGACVMEMGENKYKISLRSKGTNVNAVALSFGGGGHLLASGCQINSEYEDVLDKLSFAVSRELIH
jgi:phosphoesterase RecJ-like protein